MVRGDTKRTIRTTPLKGWYGGTVDGWYAERGVEMTDRERILQHVWRAKDYADMGEKDFNRVMNEITSLEELEAVANRKKHLRAPMAATTSPPTRSTGVHPLRHRPAVIGSTSRAL